MGTGRDASELEEAIDKLVGVKKDFLGHLQPGSTSAKHQLFLQFAADEYERLANSIEDDGAANGKLRVRVLKKAEALRQLAVKGLPENNDPKPPILEAKAQPELPAPK